MNKDTALKKLNDIANDNEQLLQKNNELMKIIKDAIDEIKFDLDSLDEKDWCLKEVLKILKGDK